MQSLRRPPSIQIKAAQDHHMSLVSQRSFVPRPLSEATEFSDTEFEDDLPDENFTTNSAGSQTTVSTFESVKTPDTAGLGGFEFHFDDKPLQQGPPSVEGDLVDVYYGISPCGNIPIELPIPAAPSPIPTPPINGEPSSRLNAEDDLDESNVRNWSPEDVADWMYHAGHDDCVVDQFLDHDINGQLLLDLQYDDLRELDITSHSKRNEVLDSIRHLRGNAHSSLAPLLPAGMGKDGKNPAPQPRRGRHHHATSEDYISPGESISIVAIEQILPKEHVCSKGENCKKWRKRQRKIEQLQEEAKAAQVMPTTPMTVSTTATGTTTRPSEAAPSVVASSDVLGPSLEPPSGPSDDVTPENLSKLSARHSVDPQENIRTFLGFQHVSTISPTSQQPLAEKLRNMPKLTIPVSRGSSVAHVSPAPHGLRTPRTVVTPSLRRSKTPVSAIRHPYHVPQSAPGRDSRSFGPYSPADVYRLASPFSEVDVPCTIFPEDPLARDTSQSVPPDMHFGSQRLQVPPVDPVMRPSSARGSRSTHRRHPSFTAPSVPLLPEEGRTTPQTTISSSTRNNMAPQPPPRNPARLSMTSPQTAIPARPPSRASTTLPASPYTHVSTPFPSTSPTPPPQSANAISRPPPTSSSAPRTTSTYNSMSSSLLPAAHQPPLHQGPMRRRKTTKLLRHEWQDGHFALTGTSLAMYRSAESCARNSKALDYIDVDDYAIACSSVVSGKKLGSGFYKNILGRSGSIKGRGDNESKDPKSAIENIRADSDAFAFSLIPLGSNSKYSASTTDLSNPASSKKNFLAASTKGAHYFSVKTRDERIDWMRELMLAKALKKGREAVGGIEGGKIEVNGMSAMI